MERTTAFTILVTAADLPAEATRTLHAIGATLEFFPERSTEDAYAQRFARGDVAGVMMRGSPPFTRRVLDAAKGLRIIAKVGSGLDTVDLEAARAHGIALTTSGEASADAVAEHTLALMLSLARDLPRLDRITRAGRWEQREFKGREFGARTVGVLGYGGVGQRVARLVEAFGARVLVHTLSGPRTVGHGTLEPDFDRFLAAVDILTLHARLEAKTRGLIGARELALMKPDALLINTARGALIDEAALTQALTAARLGGAGLDVFAKEPLDPDSPLLAAPNVIVSSHVGASARETVARVASHAAHAIVEHLGKIRG